MGGPEHHPDSWDTCAEDVSAGEVHGLREELAAAEEAYWEASLRGFAQGNIAAAATAIRRVMGESSEPITRARLLPAYIEIMLSTGDLKEAHSACGELEDICALYESAVLGAICAQARGVVALAQDDSRGALLVLRQTWQVWQELGAPYEAARVRVLLGLADRALRDEYTAALELEAAQSVFGQLGAAPDLSRVNSLIGGRRRLVIMG